MRVIQLSNQFTAGYSFIANLVEIITNYLLVEITNILIGHIRLTNYEMVKMTICNWSQPKKMVVLTNQFLQCVIRPAWYFTSFVRKMRETSKMLGRITRQLIQWGFYYTRRKFAILAFGRKKSDFCIV